MGRCRRTACLAVLIVSVVGIGGCASSDTAPAGATAGGDDVKRRDTIECMNQARQVRATPQGPQTVVNQDRYQQCMKERGHFTTR